MIRKHEHEDEVSIESVTRFGTTGTVMEVYSAEEFYLTNKCIDECKNLIPEDISLPYLISDSFSVGKTFKWNEFIQLLLTIENFHPLTRTETRRAEVVNGVCTTTNKCCLFNIKNGSEARLQTLYVDIRGETLECATEHMKIIKEFVQPHLYSKKTLNVQWFTVKDVYEIVDDFGQVIHTECYPQLNVNSIDTFIEDFIHAKECVLILKGPPGTGKTSLIREIVNQLCEDHEKIIYASDAETISQDGMFVSFATDRRAKVMVLEDIDLHLTSRSDGNTFMYKLLGSSDGFIRNVGKKIIISTNIPNIKEIDSALLREGRCYGVFDLRKMTYEEAQKACVAIGKDPNLLKSGSHYTLAELYSLK